MSNLPFTPSFRALAGVLALLVLSACGRESLAPEPGADGSTEARIASNTPPTKAADRLPLRSNSIKYRDSGAKPVVGRAGFASLSARALLGRDGRTQVEATTGQFDTGVTPPGTITRVQVKHDTPAGSSTSTFNDLSGGGYWSELFTGLTPGMLVQVQATVRDEESNRANVVKVEPRVVRRPDLAVADLAFPAQMQVGRRVNVMATITELNGDVGARFDCVLVVDGVAIDRALGSWVDAGDAVGCAFATTFATPGTKQITVAAMNVAPGDWDDANNSVSGTIDVVNAEIPLDWSLTFRGEDRSFDWNMVYAGVPFGKKGSTSYRSVTLAATTADTTSFRGGVTFAAAFVSADVPVGTATVAAAEYQWGTALCRAGRDGVTGTWFEACRYPGDPLLDVWVSHRTARTLYFGYDYWSGSVYHYSEDRTEGFGTFAVGTTFALDVSITDATGMVWRARASTPVTSTFTDLSCNDPAWAGAQCEGWDHLTAYIGKSSGN